EVGHHQQRSKDSERGTVVEPKRLVRFGLRRNRLARRNGVHVEGEAVVVDTAVRPWRDGERVAGTHAARPAAADQLGEAKLLVVQRDVARHPLSEVQGGFAMRSTTNERE